ncbi:MAG: BREX-1 system adenine-specific DNA-methyltransferase PglX [Oscillospiraceae bacterium]|nr:BREX-1 system adenine-specific DNA-methyltransferase PglX [Oscillospiraceae bacterium]
MNKTAIRNFAVAARAALICAVTQRAAEYGITQHTMPEPGHCGAPAEQIGQRGLAAAAEEAAYAWFSRIIALRYLEANGYLPDGRRIFTDETGAFCPANFMAQGGDEAAISSLAAQCNALNAVLPELFGILTEWEILLCPPQLFHEDGVIARMAAEIPEEDWRGQVQIVGWLFQYYNTEAKEQINAGLKQNIKIPTASIPAATQIFTPDWIVRYLVENSLGRLWAERCGIPAGADWQYYLKPEAAPQDQRGNAQTLCPEQLRFLDPCMGTGHILVYAFDLLTDLYRACGYPEPEAARLILRHNLFGLDLDRRAYQLACFAVMMKAREHDPQIFSAGIRPNLACFADAAGEIPAQLTGNLRALASQFADADTFGSLAEITAPEGIGEEAAAYTGAVPPRRLSAMIAIAQILSQRYDAVCTNPPYMAGSSMNPVLSEFVRTHYPDSKSDLFAAFTERCMRLTRPGGFAGLLTPYVWMFIQSYETLRGKIYADAAIESLIQFEYSAFEEATVPICAFVLRNRPVQKKGSYIRLTDFRGGMEIQRQKTLEAIADPHCGYYYEADPAGFLKIPGKPVAYWVSEGLTRAFGNPSVGALASPRQGLATGCNARFVRLWHEVPAGKICFDAHSAAEAAASQKKWFPYNKGGEFRKWYGNHDFVVNWEHDGREIRSFRNAQGRLRSRPQNTQYYFRESVSWSLVSSASAAFRYKPPGFIFDIAGMSCFSDDLLYYLLGFANSPVVAELLRVLAPTINFQAGNIADLPLAVDLSQKPRIEELVRENIALCKTDWDSFETSWDFVRHPLLPKNYAGEGRQGTLIADAYREWDAECAQRFCRLKENEEALNRLFIGIYGMENELRPEAADRNISVRRADRRREVKSLLSYAVGCLFGRYSADCGGLVCAGGEPDAAKYRTVMPAENNILPIGGEGVFADNITGRVIAFLRAVYGADTLAENLRFIAETLGGKGTPQEVLAHYFENGFYADHCKIYRKCPIYWMFSSGKQHGFQALVYMHRWQPGTVGTVCRDYLQAMLPHCRAALTEAGGITEPDMRKKQQEKLRAQLAELTDYAQTLQRLAQHEPAIDPDDGVRVNYAKLSGALEPIG